MSTNHQLVAKALSSVTNPPPSDDEDLSWLLHLELDPEMAELERLDLGQMTTEELNARLEDLPQELYDMIYKLTFTPSASVVRVTCRQRTGCVPELPLNLSTY